MILNEFKIMGLISSLDAMESLSDIDMRLRDQVMQFIEFIVVHYTQKVLAFKRIDEIPSVAFASFLENDKVLFDDIKVRLDAFMANDIKDIKEITITVNKLMSSAI